MRAPVAIAIATLLPQAAWADCIYTGAKRAYLECIYGEVVATAASLLGLDSAVSGVDARLTLVETDLTALQGELATCDSRLDQHDLDLAGLTSALDAATLGLQADVDDLDARVSAVEDDNAAIHAQLDGMGGGAGIQTAAMVRSEGGNATGSNANMLTLNLNLSGKQGHWLHVYGSTAISENGNTSNTAILRLVLDNNAGSTMVVSSQRQGIGAHSNVDWTANSTASLSAQGYIQIPAAYAVTNATVRLNGGIDGTSFYWGDQAAYTNFDGELAGAHLGYALF